MAFKLSLSKKAFGFITFQFPILLEAYKNNYTNSKGEKKHKCRFYSKYTHTYTHTFALLRAKPLQKLVICGAINKCNRPPCSHAYFVAL